MLSHTPTGPFPATVVAETSCRDGLAAMSPPQAAGIAARWFPDRPLAIAPRTQGLATVMRSAQDATLLATNIGGDSDSVASNHHNLAALADELARLRR
jgi:hypothetical protein